MKFLVLFTSDEAAQKRIAEATPEQVKASMAEWVQWRDEAVKTVGFEWGLPLRPVATITAEGVEHRPSNIGGHATMEGEREAVIATLRSHPHLRHAGTSIELLEMIPLDQM